MWPGSFSFFSTLDHCDIQRSLHAHMSQAMSCYAFLGLWLPKSDSMSTTNLELSE